jgi:hypothetical protein
MPQVFDYSLDYKTIDFRDRPDLYRIGKGEQGVLLVEPYKREILPFWRFRTPAEARASARQIYSLFLDYGRHNDFVGMDMARKFLQMGYTRARRYANHKSGRKYNGPVPTDKKGQSGAHGPTELPRNIDLIKAESAAIFKAQWERAKVNHTYKRLMRLFLKRYHS